jgi:3-oxoacyl-[acyl-carrier protein] reductase
MSDSTPTITRTAIVTGASRGIGRAIAIELGSLGLNVAINFNSSASAADEAAALVTQAGGQAMTIQGDVGSTTDRKRIVESVEAKWGRIDLLINNAGVAPKTRLDLLETTEESFDYVVGTNLKGPFFLSQLVANHMVQRISEYPAGHIPAIVNVGSISAFTVSVNRGEYCVAKAGIGMMTQLFAARLAEHGIHVYEIRPGVIATDMTSKVKGKYDKMVEDGVFPLRRWGQPEDIAKVVRAIAQGLLPYCTGQAINIDGGFHMLRL